MKTQEQIKQEVVNYLTKSTNHLFQIDGLEHKVLLHKNFYIRITGESVSVSDIDNMIKYYGNNTKNVIKHELFLNSRYKYPDFKEIKTIPYYKLAREKYGKVLESIKDKEDAKEIREIIKNLL